MKNYSGMTHLACLLFLLAILESQGEESHKIPMRLLKTGANLKQPQIVQSGSEVSEEADESGGSDEVEPEEIEYSDEGEGDDEPGHECDEGFYWHLRGARCVPLRCPRKTRDHVTGLCRPVYSHGGGGYAWNIPGRYYRSWIRGRARNHGPIIGRIWKGRG